MKLEYKGYTFNVEHEWDGDHDAPWIENDGHGVVSDWTTRKKRPGERIIASDRGSHRFYDVRESMIIARRDSWGVKGGKHEGETDGAYAARAVGKDYEYLKGWCDDSWGYVGVVVTHGKHQESVWGIESNARDYLDETARDLADEIINAIEQEQAQARVSLGTSFGCTL